MGTDTLTVRNLGGLFVAKVRDKPSWLNLMFYGPSGVGKTQLLGSASTVPDMSPMIIVDIEGGTQTLRHSYPDVESVSVRNTAEFQSVYDELHSGTTPYRTVGIDSGTEAQHINMRSIMSDVVSIAPDRDPDVPSMREHGKNLERMRNVFRGFRDLPMHTIFTALDDEKYDDNTGRTTHKPKFTGQFRDDVPAILDIVLYYYMKTVNVDGEAKNLRLLTSVRSDTVVAKDRTGALPEVIQEPTMQILFDLIKENIPKETIETPVSTLPESSAPLRPEEDPNSPEYMDLNV